MTPLLNLSNHAYGTLLCVLGIGILTTDSLLLRLVEEDISNGTVLFYRYSFYGITVLSYITSTTNSSDYIPMMKKFGYSGCLLGLLLGVFNLLFTSALQYTYISIALVIISSNSLFAAFFSYMLLGETIKLYTAVVMVICLSAIVYIFNSSIGPDSSPSVLVGNICAACTAVAMGLYLTLVRVVDRRYHKG